VAIIIKNKNEKYSKFYKKNVNLILNLILYSHQTGNWWVKIILQILPIAVNQDAFL